MRTLLPADLEQSARAMNALVRSRNVPDAAALVRMALAYAVSGLSLKDVAAWARAIDLAQISGPALFYRLRQAEAWLAHLLAQTLAEQVRPASVKWPVRVVDAMVINGRRSGAVEWRADVLVDPASGGFRAVELTRPQERRKRARPPVQGGELLLAHRAYATAPALHAVREARAHLVVRFNPVTLRTCDHNRKRIFLKSQAPKVPLVGGINFRLTIPVPPKPTKSHRTWDSAKAIAWIPARAVAGRTRQSQLIWLLTTLPNPELPTLSVLELFRFRSQIELLFNRLKSLLHLDSLPYRQGPTAKSWMLARLLAAALTQRLLQPSSPLSPWGYELRPSLLF